LCRIVCARSKPHILQIDNFDAKQEADTYIGVQYNGYKDHHAFYSDMSAILDDNTTEQSGYFAIPHLVLQSFDDPISTWRTDAANDPMSPLFSKIIAQEERSSNLVVLLTEKGGHVGWPVGSFPRSWEYMNTKVAAGFVLSYVESFRSSSTVASLPNPEE
jgi:predicted alpha/beta-fold hydrolase